MYPRLSRLLVLGLAPVLAAGLLPARALAGSTLPAVVDFNRDIRPILADNCYACHGPDKNKRKAHLRLDTRDGLFVARKGKGPGPIVPGKPDASELFRRVTTPDAAERMPEPKSGKSLAPYQIAVIKKWIEQGAPWKGHWAYLPPTRPPLPPPSGVQGVGSFVKNPIDRFILARLHEAGLHPSAEADRVTLLRRLSFDLTGLPPTPADVEAFVHDRRPDAYEQLVERLLDSPHYGERMALYWLDLVRYADSIGYHSDNPMPVAPYRDYVIHAFNTNERFDQFTIEQLAGDLLPGATLEQKVASAYNRLLQTTEEGGAQPKEYQAKYAADRVRNASTVWLGATMGCCECHDHKFDPYSTRDFYRFAAFFADVQEPAVGPRGRGIPVPDTSQAAALGRLDRGIEQARQRLATPTPRALALAFARRTAPLVFEPALTDVIGQQRQKAAFLRAVPTCLVTVAGTPRVTRILRRGNWMDDSGEVVTPGVPHFLPQLPPPVSPPFKGGDTGGGGLTRLDLARWIMARDNPLTARVFVNRLWKLFFGQGLSRTLDDLGSQGEWPTHPELLDWLACEFRDSGWDVKHLVRLMVTSGAYRQTSRPSPELKERDPYNRLVGRQGTFRLDAEFVRDNALAISGLLADRIGGRSVFPYQPPGYWDALNFPPREWHNDTGPNLYRRGLYTHRQRTFPHPSLLAFDAPSREEATCERARSNIPQQALVLLNDPTYVEAARVFAAHIIREGGPDMADRLRWAFARALSRPPRAPEVEVLSTLYTRHYREYARDPDAARKLLSVGAQPAPAGDAAELAAWTSVARTILNLHETITRY